MKQSTPSVVAFPSTEGEAVEKKSTEKVPTPSQPYAVGSVESLTRDPHSLALFVILLLTNFVLFIIDVLSDVFQAHSGFPILPVVVTSCGLTLFSLAVIVAFNTHILPHFHIFSRSFGGERFFFLQLTGYFLSMGSMGAKMFLVLRRHEYYGGFTALSIAASSGDLLLAVSTLYFERPPRKDRVSPGSSSPSGAKKAPFGSPSSGSKSGLPQRFSKDVVGSLSLFSLLLMTTSWMTSKPSRLSCMLQTTVLICFVLLSYMTLYRHGRSPLSCSPKTPTPPPIYSLIDLQQSSLMAVLAQLWSYLSLLLSCFSVGKVFMMKAGGESLVWNITGASTAIISVGIHSVLLRRRLAKKYDSQSESTETSWFGCAGSGKSPLLATLASSTLYVAVQVLFAVEYSTSESGFSLDIKELGGYKSSGLLQLQSLFILLMFTTPPLTHVQGRVVFGDKFIIWNPFGGPVDFLVWQVLAWSGYASALLALYFHLSHPTWLHLLLMSSCLFFAQVGVYISLRYFVPSTSSSKQLSSYSAKAISAMTNAQRTSLVVHTVFNGELFLAILFSAVAFILRCICDVGLVLQKSAPEGRSLSPKSSLLFSDYTSLYLAISQIDPLDLLSWANFLALLAVPVAQISMRRHIRILYNTENRSVGYVSLVTLGWALYLGTVTTCLLQLAWTGKLILVSPQAERAASFIAFEGLIFCLPLTFLIWGFFFEIHKVIRTMVREERLDKAMEELREWSQLHVSPQSKPQDQKKLGDLLDSLQLTVNTFHHRGKNPTDTDKEALHDAAYYITVLSCLISASVFLLGALFLGSHRVIPFVFSISGLLVVSLSCWHIQYSYGHSLYDDIHPDVYHFFTPFRGGTKFIFLQGIGWSSFTLCWFLFIAIAIEGRLSSALFFVLGGLGAFSQLAILISIPYFDCRRETHTGYVARNSEVILAASILIGSFFFSRLYEGASAARTAVQLQLETKWNDANARDLGALGSSSTTVSAVVCSLSVFFAIPMVLSALQREAEHPALSRSNSQSNLNVPLSRRASVSQFDDSDEEDEDEMEGQPMQHVIWSAFFPPNAKRALQTGTQGKRLPTTGRGGEMENDLLAKKMAKNRLRYFSESFSRMIALLFVYLVPFVFLIVVYSYRFDRQAYQYGVKILESISITFAFVLALPTLISIMVVYGPKLLTQMYYYSCAWFLWSIPTITVFLGFFPPLFAPCFASTLWGLNMIILSFFSPVPHLPLIAFTCNTAFLGGLLSHYFYKYLYVREADAPYVTCFMNLAVTLFWTWYDTRFFQKPAVTGCLYSPTFRRWFQKYVNNGAAGYFSLKVIRVDTDEIEGERELMGDQQPEPPVDRSDPKKQYLFSFHPHGVFPGSSLYATACKTWDDVIGSNDENIIVTHAADVIFLCPLMREIPLSVGALSVSRRGIETSIANGNSPLIITGGQSEMLLTKCSDTEMHLVCHHLGFIKLAMKHSLPLVPVLSFSECNIMDNVHFLKVQRWFVKRLGYPGLVLPHGFCYTPLPVHRPITIVVGRAIKPYPGRENPDDTACVEEMRARYFNHLQTIFYKYRAAAGYPNMILYLHNGIYDPGIRISPPEEADDVEEKKLQ